MPRSAAGSTPDSPWLIFIEASQVDVFNNFV